MKSLVAYDYIFEHPTGSSNGNVGLVSRLPLPATRCDGAGSSRSTPPDDKANPSTSCIPSGGLRMLVPPTDTILYELIPSTPHDTQGAQPSTAVDSGDFREDEARMISSGLDFFEGDAVVRSCEHPRITGFGNVGFPLRTVLPPGLRQIPGLRRSLPHRLFLYEYHLRLGGSTSQSSRQRCRSNRAPALYRTLSPAVTVYHLAGRPTRCAPRNRKAEMLEHFQAKILPPFPQTAQRIVSRPLGSRLTCDRTRSAAASGAFTTWSRIVRSTDSPVPQPDTAYCRNRAAQQCVACEMLLTARIVADDTYIRHGCRKYAGSNPLICGQLTCRRQRRWRLWPVVPLAAARMPVEVGLLEAFPDTALSIWTKQPINQNISL